MTKHDNVSQEGIMKATGFVRKFGWVKAKSVLSEALKYRLTDKFTYNTLEEQWDLYVDDLKRLVESHELVIVWRMPEDWRDSYDGDELGLHGAKMYLDMYGNYELVGDELERFKQAIADVEACHEVN